MKTGEIVRLRSTGKIMAVVRERDQLSQSGRKEKMVECVFLSAGQPKHGLFPLDQLEKPKQTSLTPRIAARHRE
jgi:uncharacterized protein YodC (DUF2158 family)